MSQVPSTICATAVSHYHNPATGENVATLSRVACTPSLGHLHLPVADLEDAQIFDCVRVWYDRADALEGEAGRCGFAAHA